MRAWSAVRDLQHERSGRVADKARPSVRINWLIVTLPITGSMLGTRKEVTGLLVTSDDKELSGSSFDFKSFKGKIRQYACSIRQSLRNDKLDSDSEKYPFHCSRRRLSEAMPVLISLIILLRSP